eukprot:scaffold545_cov372-Pavlova_lutheri.AAC.35
MYKRNETHNQPVSCLTQGKPQSVMLVEAKVECDFRSSFEVGTFTSRQCVLFHHRAPPRRLDSTQVFSHARPRERSLVKVRQRLGCTRATGSQRLATSPP